MKHALPLAPRHRQHTLRPAERSHAPNGRDHAAEKLDRIVRLARGHRRALVLTHDNPDPDALASAVALAHLLEKLAGVRTLVAYGGIVGRAENRALVRVLKLPVVPVSRVVFDEHDLVCMVDTQPEQGNHSLPASIFPDVVIDHHPARPETRFVAVSDVGGRMGSTSTLLANYFRQSGLRLPPAIATALYYGIKADTRDLGRETTPQDVATYLWLFPMVDKEALVQIEQPRLPAAYFRVMHAAIERAVVHGPAVVCDLGEVYAPDVVAEVAERFLFLDRVKWSLAFGTYGDQLYFSLRVGDRRMNAGRLIRDVIEAKGGVAGGHGSMAGARIPLRGLSPSERSRLRRDLVRRFLEEFGVQSRTSRHLVGAGAVRPPRRAR
jgi:nanoRNase/pAp phosphatase (c-di-AMP/oligoRNAs hydrolase)